MVLLATLPLAGRAAAAEPEITAIVRCQEPAGSPLGNRFGSFCIWHFSGTTSDERIFLDRAEAMPDHWLKTAYPWMNEVEIFAASGGSYLGYPGLPGDVAKCEFTRDLFKDPANRAVTDDYDFSPLIRACRNVLRQGLKPCLKLHSVPIKYSARPRIEWFRMNNRPPDDYRVYADYISALVAATAQAFGRDEVSTWRWIVGSEMENRTWFEAAGGGSEATLQAFCSLYDWTVFGVERVLGPRTGPIGTHAWMVEDPFWRPERFIEHCARGTNAATGRTGTRLDFLGISVYDRTMSDLSAVNTPAAAAALGKKKAGAARAAGELNESGQVGLLESRIRRARAVLHQFGFGQVSLEVCEGGIVFGTDGKWLWTGLCPGGAYDASWTALSFKRMLDSQVTGWARWPVPLTGGLFDGIETASTHALRLFWRMAGDDRLAVSGVPDAARPVGVVASRSPDRSAFRLLAYHHAPDKTRPDALQTVRFELHDLPGAGEAEVTIWRVDPAHGDFWPQWEKDRAARGIGDDNFQWSHDQVDVAHALKKPQDIAFWRSQQGEYQALARMPAPLRELRKVRSGALTIACDLPAFSVVLVEVKPAAKARAN